MVSLPVGSDIRAARVLFTQEDPGNVATLKDTRAHRGRLWSVRRGSLSNRVNVVS